MIVLLLACVGKGGPSDEVGLGTLTSPEGDTAVVLGAGYGFNFDGAVAIFMPGTASASCADVAAALANENPDPDIITPAGTCSAFLYADYDVVETTFTGSPASLVLNCAFGAGEWALSDACDGGYCFSGHYWTGAPEAWSMTVSGGDEADYALDMSLSDGAGQYPYESLESVALTGEVSGVGTAAWCPEIGQSSYF